MDHNRLAKIQPAPKRKLVAKASTRRERERFSRNSTQNKKNNKSPAKRRLKRKRKPSEPQVDSYAPSSQPAVSPVFRFYPDVSFIPVNPASIRRTVSSNAPSTSTGVGFYDYSFPEEHVMERERTLHITVENDYHYEHAGEPFSGESSSKDYRTNEELNLNRSDATSELSPVPEKAMTPPPLPKKFDFFRIGPTGKEEASIDAYHEAGFGWVSSDHPTRARWSHFIATGSNDSALPIDNKWENSIWKSYVWRERSRSRSRSRSPLRF